MTLLSSRRRAPRADVAITGIGLLTPAGLGTEATWKGLCAGLPTASAHPALAGLEVDFACALPGFDAAAALGGPLSRRMDRFAQLAMASAVEAVRDSGLDPASWEGSRVGVIVGTSIGGMPSWEEAQRRLLEGGPRRVPPLAMTRVLPNMAAGEIAIALGAGGPCFAVGAACASGAMALHLARELLRSDAADIMIAGGATADISPLVISSFDRLGALSRRRDDPAAASRPFDLGRDGFVMAEGAGMLVLERLRDTRARARRPYALLAGCAATDDARHPTAPDPAGAGAERALRLALSDAGAVPADVGHVNAHGTGTVLNDAAESRVISRVLPHGVPVTSLKGTMGHLIAGAGAVEAACAALSLREGLIPPTANHDVRDPGIDVDVVAGAPRPVGTGIALSNSFGFGGHNVVLALALP
ncbi:beta-ketoacyl-[acyl-carrier-protein] synthase family protein [Nonomuraea sp. SBT364]|uniref:beta-ketoacyl-[acyl-carrier-protein] synthase family protein n=1 Tax=Nonomuraea sp. SBT364 TaxID=1580530 RepID=UPI000AC5BF5D|nr:beta-ketoacyl-[acyl-carrier-protein] synthase family protein [Nonomuraea sp. SBT364]